MCLYIIPVNTKEVYSMPELLSEEQCQFNFYYKNASSNLRLFKHREQKLPADTPITDRTRKAAISSP